MEEAASRQFSTDVAGGHETEIGAKNMGGRAWVCVCVYGYINVCVGVCERDISVSLLATLLKRN